MPEPLRPSQRYMPGLDGLRALAVLAVIAYHLEFGWAAGRAAGRGHLLHAQRLPDHRHAARSGRSRGRTPRRLLARARATPAAGAVPDAGGRRHVGHRRRAGAAPAVQGSGRRCRPVRQQLAADPPARLLLRALRPRLAAEPPVVARRRGAVLHRLAAAAAARRAPDPRAAHRGRPAPAPGRGHADPRGRLGRRDVRCSTGPSFDPSRIYFGTDTRAFEILAGAALAMVWPSARLRGDISRGARRTLDCLGAIGLLAICVLIVRTNQYSAFLYRGGFVLLALATVLLLAALVHPASRLGAVLGVAPLRWIGVRSYGIYLWSVPIIVLTTPASSHGIDLLRDAPAGGRDRVRRRAVVALCRAADPPRRARAPVAPPALGGLAPARPSPRGLGGARGRARPARAHLRRAWPAPASARAAKPASPSARGSPRASRWRP